MSTDDATDEADDTATLTWGEKVALAGMLLFIIGAAIAQGLGGFLAALGLSLIFIGFAPPQKD